MPDRDRVVSAGAVVLDERDGDQHLLIVHRPRYDDWTIPKGKLDPGETARAAAVREVEEETGVAVRLGPRLSDQAYPVQSGLKVVHWWVGWVDGDHDVSAYTPNREIGDVRWVRADRAPAALTYAHDRALLAEALTYPRPTHPLVVVRHAKARDKKSWKRSDDERPLSAEGARQAVLLAADLGAYAPLRLVSSSARRCWTTLAPYGEEAELEIEVTDDLAQSRATRESVSKRMRRILEADTPLIVCGHRPVLPWMFEAIGLEAPALDPAAMVVVHHRKGHIAAVERIAAPVPG